MTRGTADPLAQLGLSETRLLLLVAAVQFVNILDFMMVMPLGPDFAKDLAIPLQQLGLVGGSYTAAAAAAGLIGSHFLDRFDRRSALAVSMLGLVIATALGGLARGLPSLVAARLLAGAFGGPATSIALSIVADVVAPARRGRAFGIVTIAFSVASVFGVPAGLELARLGSWRTPFFAVAGMGAIVVSCALVMMPRLTLHHAADRPATESSMFEFLRNPTVAMSLTATATVMMAAFSVIPHISTYVQHNLGFPRDGLGTLYLAGGAVSFFAVQLLGRFIDAWSAAIVASVGTLLFVAVLGSAFVLELRALPVIGIFVCFMTSMAVRGVSLNSLSSRVPAAHERARFMSLQSATQHLASAAGAVLSSQLLHELPDHRIGGMPKVASLSIVLGLSLPVLLTLVEGRVRRQEAQLTPGAS